MESFKVEVAYARPDKQLILSVEVEKETTIKQAILMSGIVDEFPEIDLHTNKVGIFSKPAKLTDTLRPRDRIEIYRALIADPKESRRKRAKEDK